MHECTLEAASVDRLAQLFALFERLSFPLSAFPFSFDPRFRVSYEITHRQPGCCRICMRNMRATRSTAHYSVQFMCASEVGVRQQ